MSASPPTLSELRRKPHWSYSSINGFLNICSLQWAFKYVYQQPAQFTPANLVLGKVFHQAATFVASCRKDGKAYKQEAVLDLYQGLLTQAVKLAEPKVKFNPDNGTFNQLVAQGQLMLTAWMSSLDPAEKVLEVSQAFAVPMEDAEGEELERSLIGEFDCVVEVNDSPIIADWKTAARRWPDSKVRIDLQPTCYLYAWRKMGNKREARFRFDVVTKTKVPAVEHYLTVRDEDRFRRLGEMVRVIERMVRQEHFLPAECSFACADCPWSGACTSWHRERNRSHYHLALAA
jgi:putative RecB family exonuclease